MAQKGNNFLPPPPKDKIINFCNRNKIAPLQSISKRKMSRNQILP